MSKKTETIEVRVSPELKEAFSALSAKRGTTMSNSLRALVSREIAATSSTDNGAENMNFSIKQPFAKAAIAATSVMVLAAGYTLATNAPVTASNTDALITFAELDSNQDNVLTQQEYEALFSGFDGEEELHALPPACDGTILAEEETHADEDTQDEFAIADSNKDGKIQFEELEAIIIADRAMEFLDTDTDGNGFVTMSEITEMFGAETSLEDAKELAEMGVPQACVDALLAQDVNDPEDVIDTNELRLLFAEYDANRDRRVSLMEFLRK